MNRSIPEMQAKVREVNDANGWYESDRPVSADIALLHSEVSEAYEAFRDHGTDDMTRDVVLADCPDPQCGDSTWDHDCQIGTTKPGKPEGFGSELADVFIRLLDTCERHGIDLEDEYARKVAFNATRGYRHGGKRE